MQHAENIREILEELSRRLECATLEAEEDGRILFGLDGDMGVVLFPCEAEEGNCEALAATIVIGRPDTDDNELLVDLLEGNYMGALSGDGTLAIDKRTGLLVLYRMMELPVDAQFYADAFARLVGAARLWRDRLSRGASEIESFEQMIRV